jgi:eukaryotic-like serine/threonine-protein kinase
MKEAASESPFRFGFMQLTRLGPYEIEKPLGKGGMGSVYAAIDSQTGQRVAIKALSPQLAMAEGFRERFESEIESLKTLKHDGIVRLYGYGEEDGILFYSMELVEGISLEDELKAGRRFSWREVTNIAVQLSLALKHAHDHGIIHRDIKPANILLHEDERVKLADFGIARLFGTTSLTTAGGVLGTADYMSPEQADGRPVTARCDQYSLGGVMYALLAGRPPFRAKNLPQMLQLQRFANPEPVRRYAPETPEQLERVVTQLLSKDPADRFPNTQVLARHLQAMTNALSRPASDDFALAGDDAQGDHAADDAIQSRAVDATQAEPHPPDSPNGSNAKGSSSRTATSPACQNAATLGADEVLAKQDSPIVGSLIGSNIATSRQSALNRPTRFTTIEEEEALRGAQQQRSWLVMAGQLIATAAVLGAIAAIAWHLSLPPSADELYASVMSRIDSDEGGSLVRVENEINDFIERFPEDPRIGQFEHFKERIELNKLERKLQRKARGSVAAVPSLLPAEQLYLQATGMADLEPDKSLTILESLVNLYGDVDSANPSGEKGAGRPKDPEHEAAARTADIVQLSRRRIETMRSDWDRQRERDLASLNDRLTVAEKLAGTDAGSAAGIYQAIIDLHQSDSWAESVVAKARAGLAKLKK